MKQLWIALKVTLVLTVVTGVVYPLMVTGLAKTLFPRQSAGSMVRVNGRAVGSELIGQRFTRPEYFHGRPSAGGYDGLASGGSNLGPTSRALADRVAVDVRQFRAENGVSGEVPVDAVTASGSGLDPHVSPQAAEAQVARVAAARGLAADVVHALVAANTEGRQAGVLGEARVNVLRLNIALDKACEKLPCKSRP